LPFKVNTGETIKNLVRIYGLARRNTPFLCTDMRSLSAAKQVAAYKNAEPSEVNFAVPVRKFFVKISICNDLSQGIKRLSVTHQSNDNDWGKNNTVVVNGFASKSKVEYDFSFNTEKPSVTSNVLWQFVPVVGQIVSSTRGWGKDYWTIDIEIEGSGRKYTTNIIDAFRTDIWFTNFWEEDTSEPATLRIKERNGKTEKEYWVDISRVYTGTSSRWFYPV